MKKILCIFLVVVVVFLMSFSASASNSENVKLSERSDEECVAFLKERGVVIPDIYEDETTCIPFVRAIIEQVEENPNTTFLFGYTVLLEFADDIKTAVNEYYGITEVTLYSQQRASNVLQDNTVYGTWKSEYVNYNCYAYVIGYDTWINPGQIEWINNGNDKKTYLYNQYANIYTIAGWTKDDLESLGYTVSTPTTTIPATQVSDHTHLICVRKDEDGYNGQYDYHFMRLGEDGSWYHKPGKTNPLKYKYTPSNSRVWTSEGYNGLTGMYSRIEDLTYDSTIYYIEYTTPHEWKYTYCGSGQHINTCTVCKETSGSPGKCINANGKCKVCGIPMGFTPITPSKFGTAVPEEA